MEQWMTRALELATEALEAGEVPVGCVFIYSDRIIAEGRNSVNETRNATRHAEMNCVDCTIEWCKETCNDLTSVLNGTHVVVSVEPCIMCAAALNSLGVASVTYGCANDRFGGCGSVLDVKALTGGSQVNIVGGCCQELAMNLLKCFYAGVNPNAPVPKLKKRITLQCPMNIS